MTAAPRPTAQRGARAAAGTTRQNTASAGAKGTPEAAQSERRPTLRFIAPLPPSTNNAYATVNGRRVKTKAARDFSQSVAERAVVAKALAGGVPYPPFSLYLGVWFPDESRRDLSNTIKLLEDALMKVIDSDDRHVHLLVVQRRGIDRLHPRVDVDLWEVRGPALEPLAAAAVEGE